MSVLRLRKDGAYDEVGIDNPLPVTERRAARMPIAGGQMGLSVSTSVVPLTVPDAANYAEIYVRTASITFVRSPGVTPSATAGFQADATDIIVLRTREECLGFRAIRVSANATIDVEYFSDVEETE